MRQRKYMIFSSIYTHLIVYFMCNITLLILRITNIIFDIKVDKTENKIKNKIENKMDIIYDET